MNIPKPTEDRAVILLDVDGVLLDDSIAVLRAAGLNPDDHPDRAIGIPSAFKDNAEWWAAVWKQGIQKFFAELDWLPWGQLVLVTASQLGRVVLCTSDSGKQLVRAGKIDWLKKTGLYDNVPVIFQRRKGELAAPGYVLVDDYTDKQVLPFIENGGQALNFPRETGGHTRVSIMEWVKSGRFREELQSLCAAAIAPLSPIYNKNNTQADSA